FGLGGLDDGGFGGDQQRGDGSRVFKSGTNHLHRVDDAQGNEVAIFTGRGIVAERGSAVLEDLVDNDGAFGAGIVGNGADRGLQRGTDDGDTGFLVGIGDLGLDGGRSAAQGNATTRHDAFFDGGAGRVERVIHAVLALLDFHFGRTADADHGN